MNEICELAKHNRSPFPLQPYKPSKTFSIIHSDVWGPSTITTFSRKKWFITFINDHTKITWAYLLREKSDAKQVFKKKKFNMIQIQFQEKIQVFRSDNGKEYFNETLGKFFEEKRNCPS